MHFPSDIKATTPLRDEQPLFCHPPSPLTFAFSEHLLCIYISQIIENSFCSFCHWHWFLGGGQFVHHKHYGMQITVQFVEGCMGHHWWRYIHTPTKLCHCSITLIILTKSNTLSVSALLFKNVFILPVKKLYR